MDNVRFTDEQITRELKEPEARAKTAALHRKHGARMQRSTAGIRSSAG